MPLIPYRADLGAQQDTTMGRPSEGAYTQNAESFQRLGKNVMQTGAVVSQVVQRIDEENDRIDESNATSKGREQGQVHVAKAQAVSQEDGSDYLDNFQKLNDQYKNEYLKQYKDPYKKSRIERALNQSFSMSWDNAVTNYMAIKKQYSETKRLDQQNGAAGSAYYRPYDAKALAAEFERNVMVDGLNQNKAGTIAAGRKKIAVSAYNGFLAGKKYEEAAGVVREFQDSFGEEAAKYISGIKKQKEEDLKIEFSEDGKNDKRAEQALRQGQTRTFKAELQAQQDINNPEAPDYATNISTKVKNYDDQLAAGSISFDQHTVLVAGAKGIDVSDNSVVANELKNRLISKRLDGFEAAVGRAVGNNQLSAKTAGEYLNQYYKQNERAGVGPLVISPNDSLITDILKEVDADIAGPYRRQSRFGIGSKLSPSESDLANKIKTEAELNWRSGNYKTPQQAMIAAEEKFNVPNYPKGVPPPKGATADERAADILTRHRSGQLTDAQYNQYMRALRIEKRREKNLQQRKNGM